MTKEEIVTIINQLPRADRDWIVSNVSKESTVSISGKAKVRFCDVYQELTHERYYWTAKDAGSLSALLKKIETNIRDTGEPYTDTDVINTLEYYIREAYKRDKWIADHYNVANLNSQFNNLYITVKYGTQTKNNRNSLADYARDLFGGR